jgi:hypothetical protein
MKFIEIQVSNYKTHLLNVYHIVGLVKHSDEYGIHYFLHLSTGYKIEVEYAYVNNVSLALNLSIS